MKRTKIDLVLGEAREMDYSAAAMTSADRLATTPAAGELVFDSTDGLLYVGDGATPGGVLVGGTDGGSITAGYRLSFSGTTLNVDRYMPIETVDVSGASPSVTMQAGHAYFINAQSKAVTLNTETIPDDHFGLEGHLEIFVSGTGYVVTGSNVVLSQALEPDAVNNCTVRFHDGKAIISVEDHIAGYVVINGSTSGTGSLYYGISTASEKFIAFNDTLTGTVISLAGATANDEKHLVGNGYQDTILTGAIDCGTNKVTVANLGLNNVQITGGTMTLGDAWIPSGSTVAVSGGGLAVEKVTGNGSVIDLGGTYIFPDMGVTSASEVTVTGGSAGAGGAFSVQFMGRTLRLTSCTLFGNKATNHGGAIDIHSGNSCVLSACTVSGNSAYNGGGLSIRGGAHAYLYDSVVSGNAGTIGTDINIPSGTLELGGGNTIGLLAGTSGTVTLTSGAILDLTGNTNATPIAPGGGIVFEAGGATVLYSSGAVSGSYMMDNVTLPAGAKLTNTAVVDVGGSNIIFSGGGVSAYASGCTFSGTRSAYDESLIGAKQFTTARFVSCSFVNTTTNEAVITNNGSATLIVSGCSVPFVREYASATLVCSDSELAKVQLLSGAGVQIIGESSTIGEIANATNFSGTVTISSGVSINLTSRITPGGTGGISVVGGTCTVNGVTVEPGTYTSIVSSGGSAVINQ